MNEILLLPQQAQSLHPNIADMVTALNNAFQSVGNVMQAIANAVVKRISAIMGWWNRSTTPRAPHIHRISPQTRAFLSKVSGAKKDIVVVAKRRKRSSRRKYGYLL